MLQEACTNIIRRAQARQVQVTGKFVDGALEVSIQDYGIGFDRERVRANALGLAGIEERATLCAAVLAPASPSTFPLTPCSRRFPLEILAG
jgi:signal transduction histidine kinase